MTLQIGIVLAGLLVALLFALSAWSFVTANQNVAYTPTQEIMQYLVGAARHIYRDTNIGVTPDGYAHPFTPGLCKWVGIAYGEVDNSAGAAGATTCQVRQVGDITVTITSVGEKDVGRPVFATSDYQYALTGHPLAFVGYVVRKTASNTALVRLRALNEEAPLGQGSVTLKLTGHEALEATGATAGDGWLGAFEYETILGPGFVNNDEEDGGFELEFDATAEIALASIRTPNDIFPIDKGLRLSCDVNITDNGDAAAIDLDIGFGTALTTNSEANIDHADMVQLIALHVDGNSLNLLVQSDNNTTDVANTDSTLDYVEGTPFHLDICVSPAGLGQIWIDGVDAGDATHANVTLQVLSTALLAAFANLEKTSDDTTCRVVIKNVVVTAGMV